MRALVNNMVLGVKDGYEKKLEIVGVGYLAAIAGDTLQLRVGFANEVHKMLTRPRTIMEVCGGQTHSIVKFGVDELLPP